MLLPPTTSVLWQTPLEGSLTSAYRSCPHYSCLQRLSWSYYCPRHWLFKCNRLLSAFWEISRSPDKSLLRKIEIWGECDICNRISPSFLVVAPLLIMKGLWLTEAGAPLGVLTDPRLSVNSSLWATLIMLVASGWSGCQRNCLRIQRG